MIVKSLPYGATSGGWYTGVALTNNSPELTRIYGQYRNEAGAVAYENTYCIPPYGIKAFAVPDIGRFSAMFYGVNDFSVSRVLGTGEMPWQLDTMPDGFVAVGTSKKMVGFPAERPWYSFIGNLKYAQERHAAMLNCVLMAHYLETGAVTVVMDLNTQDGSQPTTHPDGSHIGRDGDFGYDADLGITWKLIKRLLDAFPESSINTHQTKIWPELVRNMTPIELEKYEKRFRLDTNAMWKHDQHFHAQFGCGIDWCGA